MTTKENQTITRRNFLGFAAAATVGTVLAACQPRAMNMVKSAEGKAPPMKVKEVIDAIITACGTGIIPDTVDLLLAGDLEAEVTSVATAFMTTPDVIREVAERGANLIISHEPIYYTDTDQLDWLQEDPVYLAKLALIKETGMNIWRFHDYSHSTFPDLIISGILRDLGWEDYGSPTFPFIYTIPETTVSKLVKLLKKQLGNDTVRVVGDAGVKVKKVGLFIGGISSGCGADTMTMEFMQEHDLDLIIAGEILEWMLCSYVRDAAQLGLNKAMIVAGHVHTEEAGMKYLPEWLADILPGLPAFFVESGDPYRYV